MARPQHISDDTIIEALAAEGRRPRPIWLTVRYRPVHRGQTPRRPRRAGAVRRHPGGRVNGVRVADRWSAAAAADTAEPASRHRRRPRRDGAREPSPRSLRVGRLGRGALGTRCATTWRPGLTRTSGRRGGQGARPVPGGGVQRPGVDGGARRGGLVSDTPRRYRIAT